MDRMPIEKRCRGAARAVWLALVSGVLGAGSPSPGAETAAGRDGFRTLAEPFLKAHCVKCHNAKKASGDFRADDLSAEAAKDADRWQSVRDQLRDGLMPPAKEPKPDLAQIRAVIAWVSTATHAKASALPNQGNLIPHEALFGKAADGTAGATPARVWRLSPDAYLGLTREVFRGRVDGIVQPFTLIPERGIRDYAGLYSIDEASTEILVRNAEAIVETQTGRGGKGGLPEFAKLMDPAATPTRAQIEAAIQAQHRMAIGRAAEPAEVDRFLAFYEKCAKAGDRPGAAKTMLQAVLLRTDALFRSELGNGKTDGTGRRMLAPAELARALSLALGAQRDPGLVQAAGKGELAGKQQAAAQVRRILDDPKADKSRILKFFREYFEYHKAVDVFKDKPKDIDHVPAVLVSDTDRLIEHILAEDKDVLRRLLTTETSFVNFSMRKSKQTRMDEPAPSHKATVPDPKRNPNPPKGVEAVYGLTDWPAVQPTALPKDTRLGILMQPSWLAAFSTNFENDPVRRGRWIRERLLGGTVPDLPIGVAAQVPDEPHRTFRDRLTVTRVGRCWTCHQHMDDLGLPFENFDHYGRFRTAEKVVDTDATAKNVDKKGKPLGPVLRDAPLNTAGLVAGTGDPKLDGPVKDPRELIRRLADSERVRQVFVRHAFRFFLGRNETLSDARALQDADRAYVESGGSFKALVTALLTSDPFLYRTAAPANAAASAAKTDTAAQGGRQ